MLISMAVSGSGASVPGGGCRPVEYPLESGFSVPDRQQAVLADGLSLSLAPVAGRMQRVMPGTNGFGPGNGNGGHCNNTKRNVYSCLLESLIFKGALAHHTSQRLLSAAACDYYVYALRRLLC